MRIFLVLICSLALACVAGGAQEEKKENKPAPKKKQAQTVQHAGPRGGSPGGGGPQFQKAKPSGHVAAPQGRPAHVSTAEGQSVGAGAGKIKGKKGAQQVTTTGGQGGAGVRKTKGAAASTTQANAKPFKAQHFNLPTKTPPTKIAAVNFQQGRHIQGSQNWQGSQYTVFRNYSSQWHNRNWWSGHYNRVIFVYGGWYAWNAGYWIPAWGYAPNAYYAYDGPIYGYNGLPSDQVTANVQSALQQQGYYHGEVDGLLGPLTRAAVADYQRDHGLYTTSTIDQPTLESLGIA